MVSIGAALAALTLAPACAYLNTFYNAQQAYEEGVRLSIGSDSLPLDARDAFQLAAEKSAIVLERYPDSDYVDDALFLMAESLYRMEVWVDAATTYESYATRFPEGEHADEARLGWARAERRLGDYAAAEVALGPLLASGSEGTSSDVIYEQAMILLGTGQRERATETYRRLLAENPEFARDHELTLEFADAELAAGEYESALAAYDVLAEAVTDAQERREIEIRTARALMLEGREAQALALYDEILAGGVGDSLASEIEVDRGAILEGREEWEAAEQAYLHVAELAPGTPTASRATLHRGRIVWKVHDRREEALDILLDAFIHSPMSAWGDSARTESREVARLIHFERIADGVVPVPQIEDAGLARSTAMYRLAEEVLEVEGDEEAAAGMFWQLVEGFPESPWRPWAMLASGKLLRQADVSSGEGLARLTTLIAEYPDHQASDSARRDLGLDIPERGSDFYASDPTLVVLARVLPDASDPMLGIENQMNRYRALASSPTVRRQEAAQAAEVQDEPGQQTETPEGEPIQPRNIRP